VKKKTSKPSVRRATKQKPKKRGPRKSEN
jgi:hypothetical protein